MENTSVIPVESTETSLVNQDGKSRQLSEQGAVLLSLIETGTSSSEKLQGMMILMLLLESITGMTTNGDVIWLAQHRAKAMSKRLGLDDDVIEDVLEKFYVFSKAIRKNNPLSF